MSDNDVIRNELRKAGIDEAEITDHTVRQVVALAGLPEESNA